MASVDVMGPYKFLRQFNALSIRICFCIPPSIFIEGTEGIDKNDFSSGTKGEFFLSIDVDETILGCFSFDDFINLQNSSNDCIVLFISNV